MTTFRHSHTHRLLAGLVLAAWVLTLSVGCTKDPIPEPSHHQSVPTNPRYLAGAGGKLYVTCYDPCSVLRIDTATLQPEAVCRLGAYHPEGLCVCANRLYVVSSNIADESGNYHYDNRVYVIDLTTFAVVDSIVVGTNPTEIKLLEADHLVVACMGNYADVPPSTVVLTASTGAVEPLSTALYHIETGLGTLYGYTSPYSGGAVRFCRMAAGSRTMETILADAGIGSPFCMDFSPADSLLFISNSPHNANGDLYCFDAALRLRWTAEAGVFPSRVCPLNEGHALVLSQGLWGTNNASLARVNVQTGLIDNTFFATANRRGLGDIGQDIVRYGSHVYVSVTFSNSIEVVDPATGRSQQIILKGTL